MQKQEVNNEITKKKTKGECKCNFEKQKNKKLEIAAMQVQIYIKTEFEKCDLRQLMIE